MAGRKLSFDPDVALNEMMLVFWKNGYNGTSIDDLCRVVGVPKPSIYSYFGDKETILIKAMELYNKSAPQNNPLNWQLDKPIKQRLVQFMMDTDQCEINNGKKMPDGCFMVNTITEFMGSSEKIDEAIKRLMKETGNGMKNFFEIAHKRGELKKGLDPAVLASQVGIFVTGLSVMRKTGLSRKKIQEQVEEYVNMIM